MKKSVIVLFVLLLLMTPPLLHSEEKRFMLPLDNSPSQGPENAPVTIIEFLDFQ